MARLRARVSRWPALVGQAIVGTIIVLVVLDGYLLATWSIGLWLLGAALAFAATGTLEKRWERRPRTALRDRFYTKLLDGLGEVLGLLLGALALVTTLQVALNVCVWLFDNRRASDALSDWLLRNQENVTILRSWLVHLLRPRITLSIIASALLLGAIRPSWRLVDRYVDARKYIDRVLQITTVVVSVSFVTSEYAASYERAFAESRVKLIEKERAEGDKQERRIGAATWLREQLARSTLAQRALYAEYLGALPKRGNPSDVATSEIDAFERRWNVSPDAVVARDVVPPPARSSLWRDAGDLIRGPGEARPLRSDWEREQARTKTLTEHALEARRAVVETAKTIFDQMVPEGMVELFVDVVEDAAAETFIPRWLARRVTRAGTSNAGGTSAGEPLPEDTTGIPRLSETIEAEVGHPVGTTSSSKDAAELRSRLQLRELSTEMKRGQREAVAWSRRLRAEAGGPVEESVEGVSKRLTPLEVIEGVIERVGPKVVEAVEHGE